jgi:hypothetical protein
MNFRSLIDSWSRDFYTEPFLMACILLALYISLTFHKKEKIRRAFIIYIIAGFLLLAIPSVWRLLGFYMGRSVLVYNEMANTIFENIELCVFLFFFSKVLKSTFLDRIFFTLALIFFVFSFYYSVWILQSKALDREVVTFSMQLNVIEMLFLLIACLTYYFHLFKEKPSIDLFKKPSFFIAVSLLFYCILIIPFFIIGESLRKSNQPIYNLLFSIHFLTFSLVYLSITKAFLCKARLTT